MDAATADAAQAQNAATIHLDFFARSPTLRPKSQRSEARTTEGGPTSGIMFAVDVTDVVLSWSGGKDSAMALHACQQDPSVRVAHLLTTVTKDYGRISIHGVRRELLARQAAALGVDLIEVEIPAQCTHDIYQAKMIAALTSPPLAGVDTHAFADLFLEDVRAYRETNLAKVNKTAVFPLWGRDTTALAREFVGLGFKAVVVCLDPRLLSPDFVGRRFDDAFLDDIPAGVDPCGENGEFHTFVYDGPIFAAPVDVTLGEVVTREGFVFQDLLPAVRAPVADHV